MVVIKTEKANKYLINLYIIFFYNLHCEIVKNMTIGNILKIPKK